MDRNDKGGLLHEPSGGNVAVRHRLETGAQGL